MLNGVNSSKVVLLSTLIFPYSNASDFQLPHYNGLLLWVYGAHPIKLIATSVIPDRAIKGKSQKRIER